MPRLRRLSGNEIVSVLGEFGFQLHSQRGSHVKLRRLINKHPQVLTIPLHRELDSSTLRAIFRQACRFIPEHELRPKFYME